MFMDWKTLCDKDVNNALPFKIPGRFLIDINNIILKFILKGKGIRIAKIVFEKQNKMRRISLPNFKTYYTATVIRMVCYWQGKVK